MYYAHPQMIDSSQKPYAWYKEFVLEGCRRHRIPNDYVDVIARVEDVADPCTERAADQRRVLEADGLSR